MSSPFGLLFSSRTHSATPARDSRFTPYAFRAQRQHQSGDAMSCRDALLRSTHPPTGATSCLDTSRRRAIRLRQFLVLSRPGVRQHKDAPLQLIGRGWRWASRAWRHHVTGQSGPASPAYILAARCLSMAQPGWGLPVASRAGRYAGATSLTALAGWSVVLALGYFKCRAGE